MRQQISNKNVTEVSMLEYMTNTWFWNDSIQNFTDGDLYPPKIALPEPLQRAKETLQQDSETIVPMYLCKHEGQFHVAFIIEYRKQKTEEQGMSFDDLYNHIFQYANTLASQPLFSNTLFLLRKDEGETDCHELILLMDPYILSAKFRRIRDILAQDRHELSA